MTVALAAARAGTPDYSNAVFSRSEMGAARVLVYFTPSAHLLASVFKATPCEKPSAETIRLLVGDERAWDIHFPGEIDRRRAARGS